jgi:hypothetical protein
VIVASFARPGRAWFRWSVVERVKTIASQTYYSDSEGDLKARSLVANWIEVLANVNLVTGSAPGATLQGNDADDPFAGEVSRASAEIRCAMHCRSPSL